MAAGNKRISELALAAPLELSDQIVVERGAAPPNYRASIGDILDFAAQGSGTPNSIPLWVGPGTLGDSIASQAGAGIVINAGLSGAGTDTDYDNFVVESNVDGGINLLVGANRFAGIAFRASTGFADITFDSNNHAVEISTTAADGTIALRPGIGSTTLKAHADDSVTIGGTLHTANMGEADLLLQGSLGGALVLGDRAAPTADFGFGKLYTLDAVALNWLDHLGGAKVVMMIGDPPTAHTILSHSDVASATGPFIDQVTDGSNADARHSHALVAAHDIVDHDTVATGADLDDLVGGDITGLHKHSSLWVDDGLVGLSLNPAGNLTYGSGDLTMNHNEDGLDLFIIIANQSSTSGSGSRLTLQVNGTGAGDPYVVYTVFAGTSWHTGVDNSNGDRFKIGNSSTMGSNTNLEIETGGRVSILRDDFEVIRSASGATVSSEIVNSNTGANSHARHYIATGGTAAGDAYTVYDVFIGSVWAVGIDNSDGDSYIISQAETLGSTNRFEMETSGRTKFIRGASGATVDLDYDDVQIHSNVDVGISLACASNRFAGVWMGGPSGTADMSFDSNNHSLEFLTHASDGTIALKPGIGDTTLFCHADASVTIGGSLHPTNLDEADLLLQGSLGGALVLGDRTVPGTDSGFGKLYTLNATTLDWKDSAGLTWKAVLESTVAGPTIGIAKVGVEVEVGVNSTTRGHLTLWDGPAGLTAAYINLHSRNGTLRTLWVEDDGTLKVHTKAPSNNSDGIVVGAQT